MYLSELQFVCKVKSLGMQKHPVDSGIMLTVFHWRHSPDNSYRRCEGGGTGKLITPRGKSECLVYPHVLLSVYCALCAVFTKGFAERRATSSSQQRVTIPYIRDAVQCSGCHSLDDDEDDNAMGVGDRLETIKFLVEPEEGRANDESV